MLNMLVRKRVLIERRKEVLIERRKEVLIESVSVKK